MPLHIFEPRYKELIGECLDEEREFGLLLADEAGEREVGTTAAVVEVLERFDDGRMNIVVEGRDRFRIVAGNRGPSVQDRGDLAARRRGRGSGTQEIERCLAAFRQLAEAAGAELEEPDPDAEGLSFWIAARVDFGPEVKQQLLELRSERERVVALAKLLQRAREAVRFARKARERAATNGRVEPPG